MVNKYNNAYHSTIKMKLLDVESNKYIDSSKEINNKDPKLKVGDIVRISKYKKNFAKAYTPNCPEEVFMIKNVKHNVSWTLMMLTEKTLLELFMRKNCEKQIKKCLKLKK